MQQVLDHRYVEMSLDAYSKGYDEWISKETQRLSEIIRKEEEALAKVSEEHKGSFLKMSDVCKEFYLNL